MTDSMQATIWRVPRGRGHAADLVPGPPLRLAYIGVNGLRLDPAGTRVYVTVTVDLLGRASLYSLPLMAKPAAAELAAPSPLRPRRPARRLRLRRSAGDAYVTMADADRARRQDPAPGRQRARPAGQPEPEPDRALRRTGQHRLRRRRAASLLTNHAPVTGLVLRKFSIADADVEDPGAPLFTP